MMLPEGSGAAPLQHLLVVEKENKKLGLPPPPELTDYYALDLPEEFFQFYEDFLELSRRRSVTEAGAQPLGWPDIFAWSQVCNVQLTDLHISILTMLDEVWMAVYHKKKKSN